MKYFMFILLFSGCSSAPTEDFCKKYWGEDENLVICVHKKPKNQVLPPKNKEH